MQEGLYKNIIQGISSKHFNKICILAGAGISVAAGIPDFRSPDGVYATLSKKFNIPDPESIFDINWFQHDPSGFYAFCKMYYEKHPYKPTLAHKFMKELDIKDQLSYLFTQNIDCLEQQIGIDPDKIIECHGSMNKTFCLECGAVGDIQRFKECIMEMNDDAQIECSICKGLIKPNVVFFGEQLPDRFHALSWNIHKSDLVIVIGTSLKVFPVAGMMYDIKKGTPVMVINQELPNMTRTIDNKELLYIEGNIEESIKKIIKDLDWKQFLERELGKSLQ